MSSLYNRYVAGERETVWDELIALGDDVRRDAYILDARSVAKEFVERCRHNLTILYGRLLDLGYRFENPHNAMRDPTTAELAALDALESRYGTLPIVFRTWYESFGSVDFRQSTEQLRCPDGIKPKPGPDIYGLGSHPVLVFIDLNESAAMLDELEKERLARIEDAKAHGYYEDWMGGESEPFIPLGGWASNCEAKGFSLPDKKIDGVIYNDGGGDMYFAYELRHAFRWGGFPFWAHSLDRPNFYSPCEYKPNFEKLAPLLPDGLWAV